MPKCFYCNYDVHPSIGQCPQCGATIGKPTADLEKRGPLAAGPGAEDRSGETVQRPNGGGLASLGHDPLVADLEGDFAFQDVKRFFFPAVDVRRWTATWTHAGFEHGVAAVRVVAGRQEAVNIADDGNGLSFVRLSENRRVGHFCHVAL